ncbi:MAG: hypothetical protein V7641_4295 [Blastocatellia bacterium]
MKTSKWVCSTVVFISLLGGYFFWKLFFPRENSLLFGIARAVPQTSAEAQSPKKGHDPLENDCCMPLKAKQAWKQFIMDGQFRWAGKEDFQIPQWAIQAYSRDIERAIESPFQGGDINHDGAFSDFAVMVVDMSRQAADRFGIVIFNEPTKLNGDYTVHWLKRNLDLSSTILDWSSSGLGISRYNADGSFTHCFVQWEKTKHKYYCE